MGGLEAAVTNLAPECRRVEFAGVFNFIDCDLTVPPSL